jgi:OPT oligopeptide transporter protein
MAVGHVDPTARLLNRRDLQTLPRRAAVYDLARNPCHSRPLQHLALSGDIGYPCSRWYFPRAFLPLRFLRLHLIQSASFSPRASLRFHSYLFVFDLDFLPSYLFTALSYFSWVCWIAPHNPTVNQLFGVTHGMSMGLLTFDWGQISFNNSPLPVPWWAAANIGATVVFFYWFLVPILYVRYLLASSHSCFLSPPFAVLECLVQRLPSLGFLRRLR